MRNPELQPDEVKRVVVRLPNWVGDAVMAVPALRELRHVVPEASISLVLRPGAADIFIEADFVDEVLVYERSGLASAWNQARQWRQQNFDLAILFQNAFEAAAIAWLARVPVRFGYDTDRRRSFLTHPLPLPEWKDERHESFYYLNIINQEYPAALWS